MAIYESAADTRSSASTSDEAQPLEYADTGRARASDLGGMTFAQPVRGEDELVIARRPVATTVRWAGGSPSSLLGAVQRGSEGSRGASRRTWPPFGSESCFSWHGRRLGAEGSGACCAASPLRRSRRTRQRREGLSRPLRLPTISGVTRSVRGSSSVHSPRSPPKLAIVLGHQIPRAASRRSRLAAFTLDLDFSVWRRAEVELGVLAAVFGPPHRRSSGT
jgi:hypothetical protein